MKSPVRVRRSINPLERRVFTGLTTFLGIMGTFVLATTLVTWDLFIESGANPYLFLGCGIAALALTLICVYKLRKLEVRDD